MLWARPKKLMYIPYLNIPNSPPVVHYRFFVLFSPQLHPTYGSSLGLGINQILALAAIQAAIETTLDL